MTGRPKRSARRRAGEPAPGKRQPGDPTPVHAAAEKRARAYSWETFESGHYLSVKHGAYSPRIVGALAAELSDWAALEFPDLAAPRYRLALASWARAEAVSGLLTLFLDARGVVDDEGEPRERILRELRASERRAAEERRNLGLDPANHARLETARLEAVSSVVDLDGLRAHGAAVLAARGIGPGTDEPPEAA